MKHMAACCCRYRLELRVTRLNPSFEQLLLVEYLANTHRATLGKSMFWNLMAPNFYSGARSRNIWLREGADAAKAPLPCWKRSERARFPVRRDSDVVVDA